jgi:hypothetical protein
MSNDIGIEVLDGVYTIKGSKYIYIINFWVQKFIVSYF